MEARGDLIKLLGIGTESTKIVQNQPKIRGQNVIEEIELLSKSAQNWVRGLQTGDSEVLKIWTLMREGLLQGSIESSTIMTRNPF